MKKTRGFLGEERAAAYLMERGYEVLVRNYRCRWGEIDIICRQGPYIVFVEVRSKTSHRFGEPEESMTSAKMAKIRKTAFDFMANNRHVPYGKMRFDFIGISGTDDAIKLNHIEGAF